MTELNKEELQAELVAKYLTAMREKDTEVLMDLPLTVPVEDREALLTAILEAAEKDEDIMEKSGEIISSLQAAKDTTDAAKANTEAVAEVKAPSIVQEEFACDREDTQSEDTAVEVTADSEPAEA